jgi:polyphenol oxidase
MKFQVSATDASAMPPPLLRVPRWAELPGLVHGFFGRGGGVSQGARGSLNLSFNVGDDAANVEENWLRVRSELAGVDVVTMGQVHGARVVRVDGSINRVDSVDALLTDRPGVAVGVMTADCVPILMIAPDARVAIAVHAGWRGTLAGIAAVAVEAVSRELHVPPGLLQVALGPSIDQCCYEVDAGIGEQLEARFGRLGSAWKARGAKGHLDLRATNRQILIAAGVPETSIDIVGPCTACQMMQYFSHRASGGQAGRQLSVVGWR